MAEPPQDGDDGIGETILQVVKDGRAYAAAQVAVYKAIATARLRLARVGLIFGACAAVLGLAALIGLVVGLILTLSPHVGPALATAMVVGGTMVIAVILGWLAAKRLSRAFGDIG